MLKKRTRCLLSFPVSMLIILFLAGIISLSCKTKAFVVANFYHCPVLDTLFTYYTNAGGGLFCCLIIMGFWMLRKPVACKIGYGFLISGIFVQVMKALIRTPRPKAMLTENSYHFFIQGVTHAGFNSFPSGHTTTAFVMAAAFSGCSSSKPFRIVLFLLAAGVGYSRIYLGQHFIEDVLTGVVVALYTQKLVDLIYPVHVLTWNNIKKAFRPEWKNESGIEL